MSAANLLLILVRSGSVLAAAGLLMAFARRHPALRVAASRWGLVGALLASLTVFHLGERPRPLVAIRADLPAFSAPVMSKIAPSSSTAKPAAALDASPSVTPPSGEARRPIDVWALLPPLWTAGSALLLAQLGLGAAALRRVRRRCRPADSALQDRLAALAGEAGVPTPLLLEGAGVAGPCVAGVARPAVLLPAGWAERTDGEVLDAVLRHEIAHVANGDLRWGLFARVVRAFLWPQPLVWLFRRSALAAEEEACDRQVLAAGVSQARYAAGLIALREGRNAGRMPGLAIGAVSRRSGFGRRIEAILAFRGPGGSRLSRRAAFAVRSGALVLALGAAFAIARPAASGRQAPDPTAGWVIEPYAAQIQILGPDGSAIKGASAWLVTPDPTVGQTAARLKVVGERVDLPLNKTGEKYTATLVVRSPGLGLSMARLWPAPKRITEIRLVRPVAVRGRLFLPNGGPAAGVRIATSILVRRQSSGAPSLFLQTGIAPGLAPTAETDARGGFTLEGLPPQTSVRYDADDVRFARLGYGERIETGEGASVAARPVRLKRAGRVAGRITRNGKPVAGVRVGAQVNNDKGSMESGEWGDATTDAKGHYAIERLAPNVYNVALDLSTGLDAEVTARAHEAVAVQEGQRIDGMDFDLVPGALIEGKVALPDGKPVSGAYVGVYGPAHPGSSAWVQSAITDAAGHFRLRVPAGAQRVYMADSRYQAEEAHVTTTDGASTHVDLRATVKQEAPAVLAPREETEDAKPKAPVEDAPTGSAASFGPGEPFYGPVRLANGATVRLAFVQDGSKGNPIWRPDGRPAATADRARAIDMSGFGRVGGASRNLFLRVDVDGPARGSYDAVVQTPHPSSWSPWQTYGDAHGRSMDLAAFRANRDLRVTDMRFGLAAGPYTSSFAAPLGMGPLRAQAFSGHDLPDGSLDEGASVMVVVRYPEELEGKDATLVAFTRAGRTLRLVSAQTETERNRAAERIRTYTFSGGSAKEIDRVELRARDYEWATFKGIRLYPKG